MENNFEVDDLIDRYLSGDLNPTELQLFEERLNKEAELRELVQMRKMIAKEIGMQRIYKIMDNAESSFRVKRRIITMLSVAASILFFIALGTLQTFLIDNKKIIEQFAYAEPKNPQVLNKVRFDEIEEQIILRGDDCYFDKLHAAECAKAMEALSLYFENNFIDASGLFKDFIENEDIDGELILYMTISFIKVDEPQSALQVLKKSDLHLDVKLRNDLQYYQAIAYIQNKQFRKAKRILNAICQDSKYYPDAQHILNDMRFIGR